MNCTLDVLISYSNEDKATASKLLECLELNELVCWIAPRDIQPCKTWHNSIISSIQNANTYLVILSKRSIQRKEINEEIEKAISLKKYIIFFQVEKLELPYRLQTQQYLFTCIQGYDRPEEDVLSQLKNSLYLFRIKRDAGIFPPAREINEQADFLQNGKIDYLNRNFDRAYEYFIQAANAGSAEAFFYLGEICRKRECNQSILEKPIVFYKKAIDLKSAIGYWGLAELLDTKKETAKIAMQYYKQVSNAIAEKALDEDGYCCFLYSIMYKEGKGLDKDETLALWWLQRAIKFGYKLPEPSIKRSIITYGYRW
ncbi:toll/interleukin-1 receptor domain-containing protein [Spirosoma fluviale]|uniref:TIR domain-containing protein n=1 Tax=Spirosoma fluviale TaxID=1597977 RepID=A0A286GWC4_9BACT|nr:TIR domain-containing protein [Spirosoma fluviale]SOD99803.1 TIR domain-containing protein [Spirosoma fluviale]